jgi:hypothetical protein
MKAKLIKTGNDYLLRDMNCEVLAITNGTTEGRILSKQNCDEIFGVVDVEKLFLEVPHTVQNEEDYWKIRAGFIEGFNKAMELNKDKVFTLSNIRKAFNSLENHPNRTFTELVALLQPSEIEVEIEMREDYLMWKHSDIEKMSDCLVPKLDSEGCLILTKKI